jgi:hypothetical protein
MMPYSIAFSLRRNITLIRAPVRTTERRGQRVNNKKSRRQESAEALFCSSDSSDSSLCPSLAFFALCDDTTQTTRTPCGTVSGHLVWTGNPDASEGSQSHDHVVVARIERGEGPQLLFTGVSSAACVCVCDVCGCGCVTIHSVRV